MGLVYIDLLGHIISANGIFTLLFPKQCEQSEMVNTNGSLSRIREGSSRQTLKDVRWCVFGSVE